MELASLLQHATPVLMPATVRSMMHRAMSESDFQRFSSVRLFAIQYQNEGLSIHGFLALPPESDAKPAPGLLFNRGGVGVRSALNATSAWVTVGLYASWGYVSIASNYRGQGGSEGVEEWGGGDVRDAQQALHLLSSFAEVDETRLGCIGGSRGGMMLYMMLRTTTTLRAGVTVGSGTMLHRDEEKAYIRKNFAQYLLGVDDVKEALRQRSAVCFAAEMCKTTPLLILHGSGDRRVSPEHSLSLAVELQQCLHPYKLIIYEGADHVLAGQREQSNADIRAWLDRYVRDSAPLPVVGPHGA